MSSFTLTSAVSISVFVEVTRDFFRNLIMLWSISFSYLSPCIKNSFFTSGMRLYDVLKHC